MYHIKLFLLFSDLATQYMYQRMDASFVGIIFAVFLTDQSTKAPSVIPVLGLVPNLLSVFVCT